MWFLYLCLIVSQAPSARSPADEIVKHDGTARLGYELPGDFMDVLKKVRQAVSDRNVDEVSAELSRRYDQTAEDRAVQMVAMGWLVKIVAVAQITDPVTKKITTGRRDPAFRALCLTYVDAIVLPELSIPANPELLKAQLDTVSLYQDNSEEVDPTKVRERAELRHEYVRRLCLVWSRIIRTCVVYREIYSEDVMTSEAEWKRPVAPDLTGEASAGRNPKQIRDPVKRKAYEVYLVADQLERDRYDAATRTSRIRKYGISDIRDSLQELYGEDRTKWDELRKIVTETVQDPDIANLVIKDFTQRKEPSVWPIGPKPKTELAPAEDTP